VLSKLGTKLNKMLQQANWASICERDQILLQGMVAYIRGYYPENGLTSGKVIFINELPLTMYVWQYLQDVDSGTSKYLGQEGMSWENLVNGFLTVFFLETNEALDYLKFNNPGVAMTDRIKTVAPMLQDYIYQMVRGFFPSFHHLLPRS
jgi:hypothetical protein